MEDESERRGSNPRHPAWEADTLPTELRSHFRNAKLINQLNYYKKIIH